MRVRQLGVNNSFYGRKQSKKVINNIVNANLGNKHAVGCKRSKEHIKKISQAAILRWENFRKEKKHEQKIKNNI
jgi:hypothetical protein